MKKSIKKISSSVVAFIVICSIMNVSPLFVVDTEAAVKVPALDTIRLIEKIMVKLYGQISIKL